MVLWQRSACVACLLVIVTESCESLNECGARWRFSERVWNSLVVVTLMLQAVPDLWKPLALACDPTRDKAADEPNIQKWKMRCERCNSR